MKHQLILVDGISGSGKSSTAQYIDLQLKLSGLNSVWYHEEEDNHPLEYTVADIETMHSLEEAMTFKDGFLHLARTFVGKALNDGQIHIIESYYLQDCVRILFQNNAEEAIIAAFFKELNDIFEPMNPLVVYFHHKDVFLSIRQIWKKRGEEWKNWFVEADSETPYVLARNLTGEEAALTLWSDYQDLTDRLLENTDFPIVRLSDRDDWDTRYKQISDSMDFGLKDNPIFQNPENITGTYKWISHGEDHECHIILRDNVLITDLIWGENRLIYNGENLMVESFPYNLEFTSQDGQPGQFTVTGKRAGRFWGRTYKRIG